MKEKIKKIFAILALPLVFSNQFPFVNLQSKQEEKKDKVSVQSVQRENDPDFIHPTYSTEARNYFVTGITTTATAISDFIHDIFYSKK